MIDDKVLGGKLMRNKVVGIIVCMLLISTAISVSGHVSIKQSFKPLSNGATLFVGGSGPNNYSTIQEAVDTAFEGDTIYVYDDSSPYNESVTITKSLSIQGENKYTTILDRGNAYGKGFLIEADNVTITGFTVQNTQSGIYIGGVGQTASYNTITDNIVLNTAVGISAYYGDPSQPEFLDYGYNTISYNTIEDTIFIGIGINEGRNNHIIGNSISHTHGIDGQYGFGMEVSGAYNNISYNHVFDNDRFGIIIGNSYGSTIYRNTIENNERYGLAVGYSSANTITQNNFVNNRRNVIFFQVIKYMTELFPGHYPIRPSNWDNNYWDKARTLPVIVPGVISYSGIIESYIWTFLEFIPINCLRVDWHPAQEPYEI
jgi:parallel beta-helix repeat protein